MGVTPIYNIPFAEPTDLVRDWPDLSEDVAEAVEAAIAGVPVLAGIGSNVQQTFTTTAFTTTSTSYTDLTGLTVNITPSVDTSKVLVIVQIGFWDSSVVATSNFRLVRGSTVVGSGTRSGWTMGSVGVSSFAFLDSPATDTATTYKVEMSVTSGTAYINRSAGITNTMGSSITAIEVAA